MRTLDEPISDEPALASDDLAPALTSDDLAHVLGGAGDAGDFGRCGPGSAWPWLGNIHTPQCAAHDAAVRGAEARGTPAWLAHLEALPKLPAAIASYVRARL